MRHSRLFFSFVILIQTVLQTEVQAKNSTTDNFLTEINITVYPNPKNVKKKVVERKTSSRFADTTSPEERKENNGIIDIDTYDGVPIKRWIKESKHKKYKQQQTNGQLQRRRASDMNTEMRGDIRVLKDYYQSGRGKKDHRELNSSTTISNSSSSTLPKNDVFDVVIVGAGWAGLSAAMTLASKDITNFKVLEARDFIGGRSQTIMETFNGEDIPLDLGSMWIHSGVDNPLYDIITALKEDGTVTIPTVETQYTEQLYKANNAGPFTDSQYTTYYRNLFRNGFMDYQSKRQDSTNRDEALQKSANMYINTLSSNLEKNVCRRIITNAVELDYSARLEEMSLWWWDFDAFAGSADDIFLPGGYSPLIEAYAAPVADRILTGAVVDKIDYRRAIVNIRYTSPSSGSQTVLKAKKVIVTVPLGVLKAETIWFQPKLPKTRRNGIEKIGMGRMNKIFMFWNPSDTFWPSNIEVFSDIVQSNTDFQFFNPGVHNGGKPMLFAFFAGSEVEAIEGDANFKDEVTALAMIVLRNMFGENIKNPEKVVVTKWNQDEYSYGTYSFNKVGGGRNIRKTLAKPVRRRRLYISGEATHFRYFQTTHGAYLSGIDTARKVAQEIIRK